MAGNGLIPAIEPLRAKDRKGSGGADGLTFTYFYIADFERQLSGIISGTKMNSHNRPKAEIQR
jgi:hypothetical protein